MRSHWRGAAPESNMTGVFTKKGNSDTDRRRGRTPCEGADAPTGRGGRPGRPSPQPSGGATLPRPEASVSGSQPQEPRDSKPLLF